MNDKPAVTADERLAAIERVRQAMAMADAGYAAPLYPADVTDLLSAYDSLSALDRAPASSVDFHQRRGAAIDIIDEALESYRQFMLDDDFDYQRVLFSIMERMQARRVQYEAPVIAEHRPEATDGKG